jgi:L-serine dehydratase
MNDIHNIIEYNSIADLVQKAQDQERLISGLVLENQAAAMEQSPQALIEKMRETLAVMRRAAEQGAAPDLRSASGLSGGDGFRLKQYAENQGASLKAPLSGDFCAKAIAKAVATAEYNAAMGKIVAAPTAGSCGVLPAAVLSMMDERGVSEDAAVMSLFTAGAIGMVIANVASLSGAEGGCQAECGSAAAMTAAALVELAGGTPDMAAQACAMALKNMLGLVCDPVAGLVESPCIKRNAAAVMIAIAAADMALAGVQSIIPADEVISVMAEIGRSMPESLRETGRGGLASSPTGLALRRKIFG